MAIHPAAIVDPRASIADTAEIGPYCIVGPEAQIGAGTRLIANVYLEGPTWIGEENVFYPYSSIGTAPQDLKYQGERAETRIGNGNKIREFVTIQRGTQGGGLLTQIGDSNLLMAYVHVAHDVKIGNNTVLANGVTLGGHVAVEDWAGVGAFTGVHQFCRIGRHSYIAGYSVITRDVLPYSLVAEPREAQIYDANRTGLERRNFSPEAIGALHKAFRLLTKSGLNTTQAVERIRAELPPFPEIEEMLAFMQSSARGFVK